MAVQAYFDLASADWAQIRFLQFSEAEVEAAMRAATGDVTLI